MVVLKNIINDYEELQQNVDFKKNVCNTLFENIVNENLIEPDVYYSAKAFTSIVNNIVNKKTEYINYLLCNQIELLSFLATFDDNYLSNIEHLIVEKTTSELISIQNLIDDNFDILFFLEDFLKNLPTLKKNNLSAHLLDELNKIIENCEKKYEGGNYED